MNCLNPSGMLWFFEVPHLLRKIYLQRSWISGIRSLSWILVTIRNISREVNGTATCRLASGREDKAPNTFTILIWGSGAKKNTPSSPRSPPLPRSKGNKIWNWQVSYHYQCLDVLGPKEARGNPRLLGERKGDGIIRGAEDGEVGAKQGPKGCGAFQSQVLACRTFLSLRHYPISTH